MVMVCCLLSQGRYSNVYYTVQNKKNHFKNMRLFSVRDHIFTQALAAGCDRKEGLHKCLLSALLIVTHAANYVVNCTDSRSAYHIICFS